MSTEQVTSFQEFEAEPPSSSEAKPAATTTEEVKAEQPPSPKSVQSASPPARAQIQADARGLLRGATLDEEYRLATAYCRSGLMPRGLDSPEKVLVALQICRELGLPVMTSVSKIMVMNGTPQIHSDLPLALVRRSGLLRSIKEEWIKDEQGKKTGAKCTVWRRGAEEPVVREFTVEDAKTAKLWEKKTQSGGPTPWTLYPTRMLQYRARSWALKDEFGDVLFGVGILEYDHNAVVDSNGKVVGMDDEIEVKAESVADRLNREYLETETTPGQAAPVAGQE